MNLDKDRWIKEIKALGGNPGVKNMRLELKSPQFTYYQWVVGTEHQKDFNSVVLKWDTNSPRPDLTSDWIKHCPPGDKKKGWHYRVKLKPEELSRLLKVLLPKEHSGATKISAPQKDTTEGYTPSEIDYEYALRQLVTPGKDVPIPIVEDQIEKNMAATNTILKPNWRRSMK